jgi:excisionase family DNA binding protein
MPQFKDMWGTREMAEYTGAKIDYMNRLAREGKMPAERAGDGPRARYHMRPEDFKAWWREFFKKAVPWQGGSSSPAGEVRPRRKPGRPKKGKRINPGSEASILKIRASLKEVMRERHKNS